MHTLGIITTLLGLILSVWTDRWIWKMLNGGSHAEVWLGLVPLGFVGLLLGVTLTQLFRK